MEFMAHPTYVIAVIAVMVDEEGGAPRVNSQPSHP